jgi:hypothetical protein
MPGAKPSTIRIFLADGLAEGVRIVTKSNWTGSAVVCSRAQYPQVRARPEFVSPGVYVLSGPGDDGVLPRVYVGEGEVPRKRLDKHLADSDFWTELVLFVSFDESLNKAHLRYLEASLIGLASEAKRANLANQTAPSLPPLSEADRADAEGFLDEMLVIYPLLDVRAFELASAAASISSELFLKGSGAEARGRETTSGFLVLAGARGRTTTVPSLAASPVVLRLREQLQANGILVETNGQLSLTQDYEFSAPSTAAAVLMGRTADGRKEWKDAQGRSLKEIAKAALTG